MEVVGCGLYPFFGLDCGATAPAGKSGIGVKNVHERIRLTYGEPYGIQVRSVEDEGTCVTICLPRRKKGDAV